MTNEVTGPAVTAFGESPGTPTSDIPALEAGRTASQKIRRQRLFLAAAVAAALASTGGLVASTFITSPAQQAASTKAPAASLLTAAVDKRVLAQTVTIRGTVAASSTFPLSPQSTPQGAAVQVVTGIHVKAGDQLKTGQVLLEVAGRPLIALAGAVPAFRDFKPGTDGNDVAELQDALKELGHPSTGDARGHFGPGTKRAVAGFYQSLGFDVPTTGGPGDGADQAALQAEQSAVDGAQRAVDDEQLVIRAQSSQQPPPTVQPGQETEQQKMTYLRKALTQLQTAQAQHLARTGTMVPLSEVAFLPSFPAQVQAFTAKVGDTVDSAKGPLITLSTGQLGIVSAADPSQVSGLLKAGMKVDISADSLGVTATGVVAAVGSLTAPQPASGGSGSGGSGGGSAPTASYIPVTVNPDKPLAAEWAGQNVQLTITAASTGTPVLVVPLSAVSTGADGRTTVSKLGADGKTTTLVKVTAGISGAGFVAVTPAEPAALAAGDKVVVSDLGTTAGTTQ